jgi:hypothetical protein
MPDQQLKLAEALNYVADLITHHGLAADNVIATTGDRGVSVTIAVPKDQRAAETVELLADWARTLGACVQSYAFSPTVVGLYVHLDTEVRLTVNGHVNRADVEPVAGVTQEQLAAWLRAVNDEAVRA